MRLRYQRVVLVGLVIFFILVILDRLFLQSHTPSIDSTQLDFVEEHLSSRRSKVFAAKLKSDPFVEEDLLPISNQLWQWFPNVGEKGQKKWRNVPEISAMKKTLNGLNRNKSDQADHVLVGIIRNFWLRPPSLEEYKLENPDRKDFSKGQTPLVDEALGKKVIFHSENYNYIRPPLLPH